MWGYGATAARRIPDPKVGGSNPSSFKSKRFLSKLVCGRVVYGASLRHWSLRRRGFKSRLSQRVRIPLTTHLIWRSSHGLVAKALVSEARDCGLKSRRGLPLDYKEKLTHMGLQTDTLAVRVRIPIIPLTLPPPRIPGDLPLMTTPVHDDIMWVYITRQRAGGRVN